jgi:hypothetical protein
LLIPLIIILGCTALLWAFGGHSTCYFKGFFGIPCPGCGMTRAWISLFNGKILTALYFHPVFWIVPVIAFVVIFRTRLHFLYWSNRFWFTVLALLLGVYFMRFPDTPPLDFNRSGVVPKLINQLLMK